MVNTKRARNVLDLYPRRNSSAKLCLLDNPALSPCGGIGADKISLSASRMSKSSSSSAARASPARPGCVTSHRGDSGKYPHTSASPSDTATGTTYRSRHARLPPTPAVPKQQKYPTQTPSAAMNCGSAASRPRRRAGATSAMYTDTLPRKAPCPTPLTARPATNWPRVVEVACSREPRAKSSAPGITTPRRPRLSARRPAKRAGAAPVSMITETVMPRADAERGPREVANWGMCAMPPMEPVS